MPADVANKLASWSTNEASNSPSGSTAISTNLDDNLRQIQAVVRTLASSSSIASASTTDLSTVNETFITVTGTTTITALGAVSSGIYKCLIFSGALTLTHNATSLILPTGASITTAAGDVAWFLSLGSGNWRCVGYMRASGGTISGASTFAYGTAGAPGIAWTSDTDTGFYGAPNTVGISAGGTGRIVVTDTDVSITSGGTVAIASAGGNSVTVQPGGASGALTLAGADASTGGAVTVRGGNSSSATTAGLLSLRCSTSSGGTPGNVELWHTTAPVLRVSGQRKTFAVVDSAGTPSFVSGGGSTGRAIVGSNNAFKITLGTSPGTTPIVLTFSQQFLNTPIVSLQYNGAAPIALTCSALDNAGLTITPASSMTAADTIDVIVFGREAS